MKLSKIFNKAIDENEAESKYLWIVNKWTWTRATYRIDLSALTIDLSYNLSSSNNIFIIDYSILSNNKFFGIMFKENSSRLRYLFISDENFNIKIIDTLPAAEPYWFVHCAYDNSLFYFDSYPHKSQSSGAYRFRRYLIPKNKWVYVPNFPSELPESWVGFNQKIIFINKKPGIWVYDIFLNSYSQHFPIKDLGKSGNKMLLRISGKIYVICYLKVPRIYCCYDPFSEWTYVCEMERKIICKERAPFVYYEGSLYFLVLNSALYEFSLKNFKSQNKKIQMKLAPKENLK
ncbi:unnamed protein product [Blepharisma stoltei]|uniref:Uncharacterized protein n=1 Tax=Blepharisma stoltei TaxID=1481888 RepID=A0AAU9IKM9_9CILI|nr:unnamed protein product [Blepharisma stoltei]